MLTEIRFYSNIITAVLSEPLAQSAEHLTFNQGVPRSSRGWLTMWPRGQVVKTSPFHGGIVGSNPAGVTILSIQNQDNFNVILVYFLSFQHSIALNNSFLPIWISIEDFDYELKTRHKRPRLRY